MSPRCDRAPSELHHPLPRGAPPPGAHLPAPCRPPPPPGAAPDVPGSRAPPPRPALLAHGPGCVPVAARMQQPPPPIPAPPCPALARGPRAFLGGEAVSAAPAATSEDGLSGCRKRDPAWPSAVCAQGDLPRLPRKKEGGNGRLFMRHDCRFCRRGPCWGRRPVQPSPRLRRAPGALGT